MHKDSPVAKTINTLTAFPFPPFCGTKSLHHRLRLRKRFVEWLWVWLLSASALNHPSLVQSPLSVQSIKTVQWPKHSTHSLHFLFLFFVGPSLCITDLRLRKRFVGWIWLLCRGSSSSHPSLVQSPLSVQRIKTVQWPKHLTHSLQFLFLFFVGPSLCITD